MAAAALALATYTDLPDIHSVWVTTTSDGPGLSLGFQLLMDTKQQLISLCDWAAELRCHITIELSYSSSGTAFIQFDLGGCLARIPVRLDSADAYELGAALRIPISQARPAITVTPADLRAALHHDTQGGDQ